MPGGVDLKSEVLNSSSCALCGACLDWCPYLKNLDDRLVMPFACNVEDGRCYAVCPRTFTNWTEIRKTFLPAASYSPELGGYTAVYRTKSLAPVKGQQDGGTVSSLVKTAMEEHEVQTALLTGSENLAPVSYLTDDLDKIEKAAGSRFLSAPGLRKLNEAVQQGVKKMLVVGRPCQIQALRKFQNYQNTQNSQLEIVSIGLFCMWSLSWEFREYLQQLYPGEKIEKISIPQHGMELQTSAGKKHVATEKVKEFVRPGCSYCLDMSSELADISVGAFEAEPGWNTVLVRSPQGAALLQKAAEKKYIILEQYPDQELAALKQASLNKKARNLRLIQEAANAGRITPFVDIGQAEYAEILSLAEGMVKS